MKKTRRSIFFLVAALLLAAVGLSAGPPAGAGPPPGTPGLEKAKEVANEHATELLDHLGIAGVGAGLTESGDPAVVVLTESEGVDVPATLGGLPVVVVVTGKIRALAPPSAQASFTYVCSGLICDFDGSSSRGRRLSYGWDFGDNLTVTIPRSRESGDIFDPGVMFFRARSPQPGAETHSTIAALPAKPGARS